MMNTHKTNRRGATIVETTFVLIIFTLILFSIFEYARFIFMGQIVNNAAREGCRYALVNNTNLSIQGEVLTVVNSYMAGMGNSVSFENFSVSVMAVDAAGNPMYSGSNPVGIDTIQPGDPIAVDITANFKTMFPTLLMLPVTIPMNSRCVMTCEGN